MHVKMFTDNVGMRVVFYVINCYRLVFNGGHAISRQCIQLTNPFVILKY